MRLLLRDYCYHHYCHYCYYCYYHYYHYHYHGPSLPPLPLPLPRRARLLLRDEPEHARFRQARPRAGDERHHHAEVVGLA